ncbi:hypothetical protein GE061_004696 [Apolygus lucorum]|uniref:Uncharacterized protein n=1 Tax=Apolygus lucorum TaxID=248454 RepID=A0A8S9X1P9_APOLU|nr:hypothetical protein GE061_004696 [Apolygus lucorum]
MSTVQIRTAPRMHRCFKPKINSNYDRRDAHTAVCLQSPRSSSQADIHSLFGTTKISSSTVRRRDVEQLRLELRQEEENEAMERQARQADRETAQSIGACDIKW